MVPLSFKSLVDRCSEHIAAASTDIVHDEFKVMQGTERNSSGSVRRIGLSAAINVYFKWLELFQRKDIVTPVPLI